MRKRDNITMQRLVANDGDVLGLPCRSAPIG
jgi:hypothetical protein